MRRSREQGLAAASRLGTGGEDRPGAASRTGTGGENRDWRRRQERGPVVVQAFGKRGKRPESEASGRKAKRASGKPANRPTSMACCLRASPGLRDAAFGRPYLSPASGRPPCGARGPVRGFFHCALRCLLRGALRCLVLGAVPYPISRLALTHFAPCSYPFAAPCPIPIYNVRCPTRGAMRCHPGGNARCPTRGNARRHPERHPAVAAPRPCGSVK